MKRFIIFLIVLSIFGGGGYALYKYMPESGDAKQQDIRTDTAEERDLESVVSATGEVMPLLSSVVKSEISGRVTKVHVKEGMAVKRGDLLLELDRTSLQTGVREAERSVEADRLRLGKAERNFERLKELYAKQFVGEKEYLDAETDYKLTNLNLEIAQARLEDAEDNLSKTSIVAPHDGIATRVDVLDGEVISGATSVSNGTDLLTIAELKELFMEANINEVDVERLNTGQVTRLSFDAIPGAEIEGVIDVIALSARKDGNVRVFPIEVVFEAADTRVRPGISATVEIPIASVEGAVSVLLSAVFNEDEESYIFVRDGASWEKRQVEVGINNLQHVEIKSELEVDEVVALSRPEQFRGQDDE
jgi:HlyD family secretion protein